MALGGEATPDALVAWRLLLVANKRRLSGQPVLTMVLGLVLGRIRRR